MMTKDELNYFLDEVRQAAATEIQKQMRPKFKKSTWLKQKDIKAYGRIILQLAEELGGTFTIAQMEELTGFSRKSIRENLIELEEAVLVRRLAKNYEWKMVKIY